MKKHIFLFIGIIIIAVGIIVWAVDFNVTVNRQLADAQTSNTIQKIVGGGLIALGVFFSALSLVFRMRSAKQNKQQLYLMQNGISTKGTVTFVDRNWELLVNHKPIYSIVEYSYQDESGASHTRKINNLNSDIVIRKQIQVGSDITVKYNPANPGESIMVLQ